MKKLLIVESPKKCATIQGYLGSEWRVTATVGHIRALKEDLDGIGFNADSDTPLWSPHYENLSTKQSVITNLRREAASADEIYLGTDDDREGEAIAFHTATILGLNPSSSIRVTFREITRSALQKAIRDPRQIDLHKFEAQQARSMLDLLIGFTLSPCLWRSVEGKGLSAGRCQTPALRIVYERDKEIESFSSKTSWKIQATSLDPIPLNWLKDKEKRDEKSGDVALPQPSYSVSTGERGDSTGESEAKELLTKLSLQKPQQITITKREERVSKHCPREPFITSTLQQEASNCLGLNPKATMKAAQNLYEAGYITYMRTDSSNLSEEAIESAQNIIATRWSEEFLRDIPFKKKGSPEPKVKASDCSLSTSAQGAHEAIRPTHFENDSISTLTPIEQKLYSLIWKRTIQSLMADELRDVVKLTGICGDVDVTLTTSWDKTRFPGFRILEKKPEEEISDAKQFDSLKDLRVGNSISWSIFTANEIHSSPPGRYTDASLISELKHRNIGRPSTYASLVETVKERNYVESITTKAVSVKLRGLELKAGSKAFKETSRTEKMGEEKGKLHTTAIGKSVITWLLSKFEDIVDYSVTAEMEEKLDQISRGEVPWHSVLQNTWIKYAERYRSIMASPPASSSSNVREFDDGYKIVNSKKGVLFVKENDDGSSRFAPCPSSLTFQTATLEDAIEAFSSLDVALAGEPLGSLEGDLVIKKSGKFGWYVQWKGFNLSCKETDILEDVEERLIAKIAPDAVDHVIGPFKIKRGERGNLYMFKTGGKGKPQFIPIPEETDWKRLTVEGAEALYRSCIGEPKKVEKKVGKKFSKSKAS